MMKCTIIRLLDLAFLTIFACRIMSYLRILIFLVAMPAAVLHAAPSVGIDGIGKKIMSFNYHVRDRLGNDYISPCSNSPVTLGPLIETMSYNYLEGFRLQAGIRITPSFSQKFSFGARVAYGFRDHRWKYGADISWIQSPCQKLTFRYDYDTYFVGQDLPPRYSHHSLMQASSLHTNPWICYKSTLSSEYRYDMNELLSCSVGVAGDRYGATDKISFARSDGEVFHHISLAHFNASLRLVIPAEEPVYSASVSVSQQYGPSWFFGSRYTVSQTRLAVNKLSSLGPIGSLDISLRACADWSSTPYVALGLPAASLTRRAIPATFMLMRPMEFTSDRNLSLFITYSPEGRLLSLIPGIRDLGWKTFMVCNGSLGRLTDTNNPACTSGIPLLPTGASTFHGAKPYLEMGAGIGNIMHFISISFVWRLTYRHTPDTDRCGLRIGVALHSAD